MSFNLKITCVLEGPETLRLRIIFSLAAMFFGSVWYLLSNWLSIDFVSPGSISEHFCHFIHLAGMSRSSQLYFKVIWLVCVCVICKERNNRIFKNVVTNPLNIIEKVNLIPFYGYLRIMFQFLFNRFCVVHPF